MALFFFVVGLEIKRELVAGELADPRKALLPVVAALGGMVVPAAVYVALACGAGRGCTAGACRWRPTSPSSSASSTLLGPRVPHGLKVLLLTLAIADDIGGRPGHRGLLQHGPRPPAPRPGRVRARPGRRCCCGWACAAWPSTRCWRRRCGWGFSSRASTRPWPASCSACWRRRGPTRAGRRRSTWWPTCTPGCAAPSAAPRRRAPELVSPAERLEDALHPWVAFVIMPLFALANAGVASGPKCWGARWPWPSSWGWSSASRWASSCSAGRRCSCGLTRLPEGMTWKVMAGAGCLGGHRLHDVAVRRRAGLLRRGAARRGQGRRPGGVGAVGGAGLCAAAGVPAAHIRACSGAE